MQQSPTHQSRVACGQGGGGSGVGWPWGGVTAPWLRPRRPWSSRCSSLLLSAGGRTFWKMRACWDHPLLSGTPLPCTFQMGSCREGLFSCFNNPLSTTKSPLVKISIIAYAILLALLETTFHPLNMMVALSQNSEWVWGQVVYTVI